MSPIFEARNMSIKLDGRWIFEDINITVDQGNVLVLRGPSGVGKTTLLKCLAELIPYERGTSFLHGKSPTEYGIPAWRSRVMYVPQRAAIHHGTPLDLFKIASQYASQREKKALGDPVKIGIAWNLSESHFTEQWCNLSGGEIQRCSLAVALALDPEVLLLDEPTSALDQESVLLVEKSLKTRTCIWITHSEEQEKRVATETLTLTRMSSPVHYDSEDGESTHTSATTIQLDDSYI